MDTPKYRFSLDGAHHFTAKALGTSSSQSERSSLEGLLRQCAPHLNLACTVIMVLVKAMHSPCTANLHALYAALTLTGCSGFENNRGERSTPEQRDAWGGSVPHQS